MASRPYAKAGRLLRQDPLAPCYYFHGPVDILKDEAVTGLVERAVDPATRDFNLDQRSAAELDPEAIETLCTTMPMLAERRVVVIREVEAWGRKKKAREAVLRYLARPSPDTVLLLVQGAAETKADPDLARHAETVVFEPLDGRAAETWLGRRAQARGITLEPEASRLLLTATQGDLGWLASEVDKLAGLGGAAVTVAQVEALIGVRHGETPLDWVRAVLGDEPARAIAMVPHLLEQPGASGVRLLSQLGTQLVGVALARTRYDGGLRGRRLESEVFGVIKQARLWGINWSETARDWSASPAACDRPSSRIRPSRAPRSPATAAS
jgi:DNA polymerase-3 subunit delta